MEKFRWRETRREDAPRYHSDINDVYGRPSYKYFGEITDDDYNYFESNTKRVGLSYMSDIMDAYNEYRVNDAEYVY